DSVTFAVAAVGGDLKFQWFRNGTPLAGQTGPALALSPVGAADAGSYTVGVSDDSGSKTSAAMILTVPGTSANPAFASWKEQYSLPVDQSGFDHSPAGDGVANGFKYLFDLDPRVPTVLQIEVPH